MSKEIASQRVAVTGATGFIGMHVLQALQAAGAHPIAVVAADRNLPRLKSLPLPVELVRVQDAAAMGSAVREAKPRFVVHLNGHITMQRGLSAIKDTLGWNVLSTISLLTACAETKVERVILMGSCEEYGQHEARYDANLAPNPSSPYGASKAAATAYARMFHGSFQLPTVVLRPSVVYGPGQSARQLISMVFQALAENRPIDVTEGRQTRDFVYVQDVVDVILLALTLPGVAGEAYNIGSGEVVTVRHCLELIERITGRSGLIQFGARPYPESERFRYEPMLEKTFAAFPWKPSVMLEDGLRRTWNAILQEREFAASPALGVSSRAASPAPPARERTSSSPR